MAKRKTIGAFLRIPVDEHYHTYGRILKNTYAFYDLKTTSEITDLELLEKAPVLFKLFVHNSAVTRGGWQIIGVKELPEELKKPVPFFIQEIGRPDICWIDIDEVRTRVTPSECIELERYTVWEHDTIEQRLQDHYNGIPNRNTEFLKVNHPFWSKTISSN